MNIIGYIIYCTCQFMNVFAIKRGNKVFTQLEIDLMRNIIASMFQVFNLLKQFLSGRKIISIHRFIQCFSQLDKVSGRFLEQGEKFFVLRNEVLKNII